jgi:hypothetical protein
MKCVQREKSDVFCIESGHIRGLSKSQFEEKKNALSNALKELTKDDSVIEKITQIQKSFNPLQHSLCFFAQFVLLITMIFGLENQENLIQQKLI